MSELGDMLLDQLKHNEAATGSQCFEWKGADYPCTPSSIEEDAGLEEGGVAAEAQGLMFVRKELFTHAVPTADSMEVTADSNIILADGTARRPRSGDRITFKDRVFRVLQVLESVTTDTHYKLVYGIHTR